MTYSVKEIFYTLQGEGANAGRPAVFCRFSGCNLWSGREKDRSHAVCQFCDTEFVGTDGLNGAKYRTCGELAEKIDDVWGASEYSDRFVVITGGEPLLQLDEALINEIKSRGFEIAVETNGTIAAPTGIDWLCVSPKADSKLIIERGDELKLIYPQEGVDPKSFTHLPFSFFYLQPMDGPNLTENTRQAIAYCMEEPVWRLSIQTHKVVGIS
jgi:7-carboxy-7-deazaguanine synthase (Cx14CxxC type)